jgi:hypothetical protein
MPSKLGDTFFIPRELRAMFLVFGDRIMLIIEQGGDN